MLARRLNGKYIAPESKHLLDMVNGVQEGPLLDDVKKLVTLSNDELRELYNAREIEA